MKAHWSWWDSEEDVRCPVLWLFNRIPLRQGICLGLLTLSRSASQQAPATLLFLLQWRDYWHIQRDTFFFDFWKRIHFSLFVWLQCLLICMHACMSVYMYMYVLYVHTRCWQKPEGIGSPEVTDDVSYHVCAKNRTQIPCKSNKCCNLRSRSCLVLFLREYWVLTLDTSSIIHWAFHHSFLFSGYYYSWFELGIPLLFIDSGACFGNKVLKILHSLLLMET